jgi:hypothetical protein
MRKIRRLRPGLNPRTREPEDSMLTTRPPKPLTLRSTRPIDCDVYLYSYLVLEGTENRQVSTVFRATLETYFVSLDNCPQKSLCVLTP